MFQGSQFVFYVMLVTQKILLICSLIFWKQSKGQTHSHSKEVLFENCHSKRTTVHQTKEVVSLIMMNFWRRFLATSRGKSSQPKSSPLIKIAGVHQSGNKTDSSQLSRNVTTQVQKLKSIIWIWKRGNTSWMIKVETNFIGEEELHHEKISQAIDLSWTQAIQGSQSL